MPPRRPHPQQLPPVREPSQVIRRDPAYRPAAQPPPPQRRRPPPPPPPRRPPPPPPRVAAPPPQPPPTKKKRRRIPVLRLLLALILVAVVAVVGIGFWAETSLHRITALTDYPERPASGRGTNWLLVGSDSRADLSPEQQATLATGGDVGNGRTDTIMLVHIPGLGSSAPTTMVSLPRDSYVDIPGYGSDKINAAFAVGGPQLLAQTVEQATGLHVDHYAEVGFNGFADVVDALGDVTVCPTDPINDPLAGIDLPAGCQSLDGAQALGYVRSRATPRADLDRMTNQREFMSALLHRAAAPAVWLNPWRWYAVPNAAVDALTVDDGDHVWDLARLGWALRGQTTALTVPIGEYTSNGSGDVVIWDQTAAPELFDALASDAALPQSALDAQP
ncbi:LytTR family transcriptional regulator [Mycobacterium sp. MS1601]|nr:LCP family protein [Mycobacterium sp. MS1601]AQA02910.1 LytTR family transcriptional regulator [Mycobacterium sp. MS1601]